MRDRRRTTAIVLAGGVALASAGFAIGSQSGDGSAEAARDGNRSADTRAPGHHGGPGFASLAGELGVSEERLREALEKLRPDRSRDEMQTELAAALAQSLGVEQAKVTEALEGLHDRRHASRAKRRGAARDARALRGPGRHGRGHHGPGGPRGDLAQDLADALGVEAAKVEDALEAFHDARREEFAQKLADELGIDVDEVQDALPPKHP